MQKECNRDNNMAPQLLMEAVELSQAGSQQSKSQGAGLYLSAF